MKNNFCRLNNKYFLFLFILLLPFILSCQSQPKNATLLGPQPQPPTSYQPAAAELLPLAGENCCAQYVGDRSQIVFLSRKRPRHSHFQVYIYDLGLKKERRLSYHDGDDQGPQIDPQTGQLYYASVTDSLKESPRFLQEALGQTTETLAPMGPRPLWAGQNFDLYRAERDGTHIQRLTQHPGFDGELHLHPKGRGLIFSSWRNDKSQLIHLDPKNQTPVVISRSTQFESEPNFSPSGQQLIWVRYAPDLLSSQIWIAQTDGTKARSLTSGEGLRWSPTWSPDGQQILFSSNENDTNNFELYLMDKNGKCLRRLTYSLGHDLLPAWSSSGTQILFSSDRNGSFQLYSQDFKPPACPEPAS